MQTDQVCPSTTQEPHAIGGGLPSSLRAGVAVDLDALVTAREFEVYSQGRATVGTVYSWRRDGKIQIKAMRGRSPLFRLGDLLAVERDTRQQVRAHGGRRRKVNASAA